MNVSFFLMYLFVLIYICAVNLNTCNKYYLTNESLSGGWVEPDRSTWTWGCSNSSDYFRGLCYSLDTARGPLGFLYNKPHHPGHILHIVLSFTQLSQPPAHLGEGESTSSRQHGLQWNMAGFLPGELWGVPQGYGWERHIRVCGRTVTVISGS